MFDEEPTSDAFELKGLFESSNCVRFGICELVGGRVGGPAVDDGVEDIFIVAGGLCEQFR